MENINVNKKEKNGDVREKLILFIVGLLVGAVITTGAFVAYAKTLGVNAGPGGGQQIEQMQGEQNSSDQGQPPALPGSDSSQSGTDQNSTDQNAQSQDGSTQGAPSGQPPQAPDGGSTTSGQPPQAPDGSSNGGSTNSNNGN